MGGGLPPFENVHCFFGYRGLGKARREAANGRDKENMRGGGGR